MNEAMVIPHENTEKPIVVEAKVGEQSTPHVDGGSLDYRQTPHSDNIQAAQSAYNAYTATAATASAETGAITATVTGTEKSGAVKTEGFTKGWPALSILFGLVSGVFMVL